MKKHLLFRAFLPLAAYAVFTELALHGLARILTAASDGWTGAVSPNLSAAVFLAAVILRHICRQERRM